MSRVGKQKVSIPNNVKVTYLDNIITIKGEKGTLKRCINNSVDIKIENDLLIVIKLDDNNKSDAIQGLTRSLISNMIIGVNKGFERTLEINGIGYRAEIKDKSILLNLGFSHPVNFNLPVGISASVEKNILKLSGIDKEKLGDTAACIRRLKPPEPYKGKGIKFSEEVIQRKAGKTGAK